MKGRLKWRFGEREIEIEVQRWEGSPVRVLQFRRSMSDATHI